MVTNFYIIIILNNTLNLTLINFLNIKKVFVFYPIKKNLLLFKEVKKI